jgi:hypothetical protein
MSDLDRLQLLRGTNIAIDQRAQYPAMAFTPLGLAFVQACRRDATKS